MSRTVPASVQTALGKECKTLAWCWKIVRTDAEVFGFTSHDRDITMGGVVYKADTGFLGSAAQAKVGLSVDDMQIEGAISSSVITRADIFAGVWDSAVVTVLVCDWSNPVDGVIIQTGTIGNIAVRETGFVCELLSLSQAFNRQVGRAMTRRCDATFGDARCGVSLAAHTVTGAVTAVASNQSFSVNAVPSAPFGKITWTSGLNTGASMEVKSLTVDSISLSLPMFYNVQNGDTYSVSAGCRKTRTACKEYSNITRFRGFPDIPGLDAMLEYPDAS